MHTFLFDIDGTLIHTAGAGGDAILAALVEEFSLDRVRHEVSFAGRTDRAIARDLLSLHGIEVNAENWGRLRDGYLRRLPICLRGRPGKVLPGVGEMLAKLRLRSDVALGLLTGNVRDGAKAKLVHFGLFEHFAFGGFGDLHEDRDHVAAEAFTAAQSHLSRDLMRNQVWVIGDTPFDVRCARAIGAQAVAVATGGHTRAELTACSPDFVVDDLRDDAWLP